MSARILTAISYTAIALSLILPPSQISAQSGQAKADTSKPLIEIRFARREPAPKFRQMVDPQSSRAVYVSSENVFADTDFADVRTHAAPNGIVLIARWKPSAGGRWSQILRGEVGAGNDRLAVFVDGELVSTPIIVADPNAAATQDVHIAVPVGSERARQIGEAIAKRWPGGGL